MDENDNFNILRNIDEKNEEFSSIKTKLEKSLSCVSNKTGNAAIRELSKLIMNSKANFIPLSFFVVISTNIKKLTTEIVRECFIDNKKTVQIIRSILIQVYSPKIENKAENNFEIPSLSWYINFCFKLPDILSNFFEFSFINYTDFFQTLFAEFLEHKCFIFEELVQKVVSMKLYKYLFKAIMQSEIDEEKIDDFLANIEANELYNENFAKHLYIASSDNEDEYKRISVLYRKIKGFPMKKIDKIIRKNLNFIPLVLSSGNVKLQKNYLTNVVSLLNDKSKFIVEEIEIYEFYLVFFGLYYIIENNDFFDSLEIFDGFMRIIFIVLEIVNDENKKGIIEIFGDFLRKKMNIFLVQKGKEPINIEEEHKVFSKENISFLSFDSNMNEFKKNSYYFSDTETKSFKVKFYELILKQNYDFAKENLKIEETPQEKKKEKPKTVYKSIKFQKKYGVYKEKNEVLDIKEREKDGILLDDDNLEVPLTLSNATPFKITLTQNDDYSDLKKLNKPMYIKDCLLGLNSEYKDRQELSLKSLGQIIDSRPLDLEFSIKDLTNTLLRMENNFDLENFDELVEENLVKLTKFNPNEITLILCERFFHENNPGLKNKFLILNVINKAVNEISESISSSNEKGKRNSKKAKTNSFHPYFINVIFPLLNYLKQQKISSLIPYENFDLLLSKFIYIISNMIRISENHPLIYKAVFETYELFKAIISSSSLKETKTLTLLDALNSYVNVTLNFYKESFISIYPEILGYFKLGVKFLLELLDEKQLNDELRGEIMKTLIKFDTQSKKFNQTYFNGADEVVQNIGVKLASSLSI